MKIRVFICSALVMLCGVVQPVWAERPLITGSEQTATLLCKEYDRPHAEMKEICKQALSEFDHTARDRAILLNNLGYALGKEGQLEDAIAKYNEAHVLNPTYSEPLLNLGWALWNDNRFEDAVVEFEKAFQLSPSAQALGGMASSLSYIGDDHELAIEKIDQALLITPKDAWTLVERAWILRRADRADEAIKAFDAAIEVDGSYASAHYGRALIFSDKSEWSSALASVNEAIKHRADSAKYLAERAYILRNLDRPAQALRDSEAALTLNENHRTATVQKGWALVQLGRTKEAIETLKLASENDRESNFLWFNYADLLSEDEQWTTSLSAIDHALTLIGAGAEDENFKAYILLKLDRPEDALEAAKAALVSEPDHRWALINAAYASVSLDDTKSAYTFTQDALNAGLPEDDLADFVAYALKERKFLLAGRVSMLSAEDNKE